MISSLDILLLSSYRQGGCDCIAKLKNGSLYPKKKEFGSTKDIIVPARDGQLLVKTAFLGDLSHALILSSTFLIGFGLGHY